MSKKPQPYNPGQHGPRDQYDYAGQVKASRVSRRLKRTWKRRGAR